MRTTRFSEAEIETAVSSLRDSNSRSAPAASAGAVTLSATRCSLLVVRGGFDRRHRSAGRGSQPVPLGLAATALYKASSLPPTGLLLNFLSGCLVGSREWWTALELCRHD